MWEMLHPKATIDMLGYIPQFFSLNDPDRAKEQLHKNYRHGGGWHSITGLKLLANKVLQYPGDPPIRPLAQLQLRDELIVFYDHETLAIFQPDGSFEATRVS